MTSRDPPTSASSNPSKATNSWEENYKMREIALAEWEERREMLTQLYFNEDRRLNEVRRIMATEHGFYAKYVAHFRRPNAQLKNTCV